MESKQKGFSIVEGLLLLIVTAIIGFVGWYVWHSRSTKSEAPTPVPTSKASNSETETDTKTTDPYSGWKSATSSRAKFSIKYPSNWVYTETVGNKDNVEHIVLDGPNFYVTIDSFNGSDVANGGNPATKCDDCQEVSKTEAFSAGRLGLVSLETIIYKLDNGAGNALVLRQANGTYYLTSPVATGIKTSFRGISKLDSLQAYQNESTSQFAENSDLATAKLILQSVSY